MTETKSMEVKIYGAEKKCPSCVNLPSSLETKEWLEAAINRKYPNESFYFLYIDIEKTDLLEGEDLKLAEEILADEYFYPLVTIEGEIAAEGNPRLKTLYNTIEKKLQQQ
ncbi:YuzD family protein [Alteribacillus sp. JSM 102045]|uniref:YuzD family protein n=1 Tax=Alteribacillus sp. JSM 102045 TaxID=1562101 RepID=UPI0035C1E2A7